MLRKLTVMGFASVGLLACSGNTAGTTDGADGVDAPGCSDVDDDGYGVGAECLGPDCDDANSAVWTTAQCEELCARDPHSTGCACDPGAITEPEVCYTGPAGTLGNGVCRAGLRTCTAGGRWSACDGQVMPRDEICDNADNDCDAEVDEGVRNECGTCSAECEEICVGSGEGCMPFDIGNEGSNVEECEGIPGCVTLGGRSISLHVLWATNTSQASISRIDTTEHVETGRFYTGPNGASDTPSRTSVDYLGDVVVGNRAFGRQPSVTRIASEDCPDQDGNGRVETSEGAGDLLPWGEDECVLWNADVGNPNGIARAVAVQDRVGLDGVLEERVWVGLYAEQRYVELDRTDGTATGDEASTSPCTPYGAAIDRDGNLWSACLSTVLARFDTYNTDDTQTWNGNSNYGITVDEDGKVWLAGQCQVFDPEEETFTPIPGCNGSGIAADGNGWIWVGDCAAGMCRVDAETLEVTHVAARGRGIGVAFDGLLWGVSGAATIDIVDPGDGPGEEEVVNENYGLVGPYVYTDMTGFQLRNATDPEGFYGHVFELCESEYTTWSAVTYDVMTPPGSSVGVSVRTADTLVALGTAAWVSLGTTRAGEDRIDLAPELGPGPHGRFIEVRFTLFSVDREARPQILGMGVQGSCEIPVG
jgi:hypothetical protein